VYENASGYWTIHVAGRRHDWGDIELPPWNVTDGESYIARHKVVQELWKERFGGHFDEHEHWIDLEAIAPQFAGETYDTNSPGDCADKLEEIRAAGLNVPQYAIDALQEEAREAK
jgi:hypothetical protein